MTQDQLAAMRQALAELTAPGAGMEVVEAQVQGTSSLVYKNAAANLAEWFARCADHGDKPFLVYQQQRFSFAETHSHAARVAIALQQLGIGQGDRVAIAMSNRPEWVIAFMAIVSIGAIAVPMNAWWTGEELEYGLTDCGASACFVDDRRNAVLAPLRQRFDGHCIVVGEANPSRNEIEFYAMISDVANQALLAVTLQPDDDATIFYTSGSTGRPKGVVSTHRAIISALMSWLTLGLASNMAGAMELKPPAGLQASALLTVPLFHVTGCHSIFLLSVILGRKLVMMRKWDVNDAMALIQDEKVTYFNGVPTMSQELLNAPDRGNYDLSSLVELFAGGAARPPQQVGRIASEMKRVPGVGYGLTETNAMGTVNTGKFYLDKPGSVGPAVPAVTEIAIFDDSGNALPQGQTGEICIKSTANFRGYWNQARATAEAFRGAWFRTGDLGYLDDDGYLFIVDRIKDIIIRGGENIGCLEVEAAIYRHPAIAEVAVFGLPDQRLGEIVAAVAWLKPGASLDGEELRTFLAEYIAPFKLPEVIEFSDGPLPRTGSDKIYKRQIREALLQRG